MSSRKKNMICVKFEGHPDEFLNGQYSWLLAEDAQEVIDLGYGHEYDPESSQEVEPEPSQQTDIPEDFPGRNHFLDAEIYWMEDILEIDDYDEIPGIGQSTETKIINYLEHGDLD